MDAPLVLSKGPITFDPPPGGKSLIFRSMTAYEELGRPFTYELDLLGTDSALKANDMLGHVATVHLEIPDEGLRHFNGYVTRFAVSGSVGSRALFRMTLRPWLWLLTRTSNCRIFQHKSVPDIIKQVFRDHGLTDFKEHLFGSYPAHDFVVQYRESDFNFVSRLMEEEGIYYYFVHEDGRHTLVLADSYSAHDTVPNYEKLPYYPPDEHRSSLIDYVDQWHAEQEITSGAYAVTDFDFERPKSKLLENAAAPKEHPKSDFEVFDYPGGYALTKNGKDYAKIRLEELNAGHARASGHTNARGIEVGALLSLTEHPIDEQNREYLIISARHELRTHDPESSSGWAGGAVAETHFSVIESSRPFRSVRITPKPIVQGPQTAIVVGKAGEEIWTDKYGRVKVKFHWDRFSKGDETSSCWVRVAQTWAGNSWGGIQIPRIGQEVVVQFLEGDPDQPLIVGRVYNGDNMPPYTLPANQTQSGIKSRSSKGGTAGNFNELRFEDKKGSEQVFFQAEKNLDTNVKNSESHTVGADRTISVGNDETHSVGHDRTKTVSNNETVTVSVNRTETVGNNETITIGVNRTETVGSAETITIGSTRTTTVAAADTLTVGAAQTILVGGLRSVTVGAAEEIAVGAARSVNVLGSQSLSVGGDHKVKVGGGVDVTVGGARKSTIGKDETVKVAQKLVLSAGEEIIISAGDASIIMKKNGDITIKGKNLTLDGSGKIAIKASSDVTLKGSKVAQNSSS